jgi:hypothetical protein
MSEDCQPAATAGSSKPPKREKIRKYDTSELGGNTVQECTSKKSVKTGSQNADTALTLNVKSDEATTIGAMFRNPRNITEEELNEENRHRRERYRERARDKAEATLKLRRDRYAARKSGFTVASDTINTHVFESDASTNTNGNLDGGHMPQQGLRGRRDGQDLDPYGLQDSTDRSAEAEGLLTAVDCNINSLLADAVEDSGL